MNKTAFIIFSSIIIFFTTFNLFVFGQDNAKKQVPKRITICLVSGKSYSLPNPQHPLVARIIRVSGAVKVAIVIGTDGNVISAKALSGHPLLRRAALSAAKRARFRPTSISGELVEVAGFIIYNFLDDNKRDWVLTGVRFGDAEIKGFNSETKLLLGLGFRQKQIDKLIEKSEENQKYQIKELLSDLQSRISPADLWKFNFGRAKAKTLSNLSKPKTNYEANDNENEHNALVLKNLETFRRLSNNIPTEVEDYLTDRLSKIIEVADKGKLNREDRENLRHYLR